MGNGLVLSIFPGIDLLGRAFEEAGYCVVRGPDVLWGGDIRTFHPPAGVFEGVIGGPPCQVFSPMAAFGGTGRFGNLIPEFERVVREARPEWFLMENVPTAPLPSVLGYGHVGVVLDNRWMPEAPEQHRERRFVWGCRREPFPRFYVETCAFENPRWAHAVTAAHAGDNRVRARGRVHRYSVREAARLQGLPEGYLDDAPFTQAGKLKAIANGVPLPMGRAIAQAVKRAMAASEVAV